MSSHTTLGDDEEGVSHFTLFRRMLDEPPLDENISFYNI